MRDQLEEECTIARKKLNDWKGYCCVATTRLANFETNE